MRTSHHPVRAQLDRARHLQSVRAAQAAPDPSADVAVLPSASERVRRRVEHAGLPDPHPDGHAAIGRLSGGRLKLPEAVTAALGWTHDTDLVVAVHGQQLRVVAARAQTPVAGATARLDPTRRLQLTVGQRQLLGVDTAGQVAIFADVGRGELRLVDPARLQALLAQLTPTGDATGESWPDEPHP
jgi:hypothetical protein